MSLAYDSVPICACWLLDTVTKEVGVNQNQAFAGAIFK